MIENPIPTQRALLVWQRPLDETGRRDRCAVAELVQRVDGVSFRYFRGEHLENARQMGFSGYPGLPIESDGLDRVALDVLMRRLPPRDRGDFGDLLGRFGLPSNQSYSELTLLAYTGARLTSDSFSLCETFDGFVGAFTYVFDVAGNRHYQQLFADLSAGEPLYFEREPDNEYDSDAVRIAREGGATVGYVNRLQAGAVGRWLDHGEIVASVFRVNGRAEYPRVFVRADITTASGAMAA